MLPRFNKYSALLSYIAGCNNNQQSPSSFPLAAKNRNKDSPKNIETVETPESSPNELALAAAAAAQAEYFFDPFSAAVAQAQQNTLPTPEISPQDETVSQNMFFF